MIPLSTPCQSVSKVSSRCNAFRASLPLGHAMKMKRRSSSRSVVTASGSGGNKKETEEYARRLRSDLEKAGLDSKTAAEVLKNWSNQVGHEVTPEDLRKILVGQSSKALALVLINTLFDAGAAYGAFVAGNFLGLASSEYGTPAVIGQAVAYLLAGYYATGVVFDVFKLVAVAVATFSYNLRSTAFLEALEGIAGSNTGLSVADKALEAVNTVKVLNALSKLSDELKKTATSSSSTDVLADLGVYLTLERAQRVYKFDAKAFDMTDDEASAVASAFSQYDINDDGVLSESEFKDLCRRLAPELSTDAEIKNAIQQIDTNGDGSIDFVEFVRFWKKQGLQEKQMVA